MTYSGKRLPAEKRRKQIVRCAVRVFARSNYRKTRVADIASEAGISEAMIYKHFPSKKSIFIEVLQNMSERMISRLLEEGKKEKNALEAIRNMAKTFYNLIVSHPDEVKVQFQAISEIDDEEIADRLHLTPSRKRASPLMVILVPPRLGGPDTPDHLAIVAFRARLRGAPAPHDLFGLLRVENRALAEFFARDEWPLDEAQAHPDLTIVLNGEPPPNPVLYPVLTARAFQLLVRGGYV